MVAAGGQEGNTHSMRAHRKERKMERAQNEPSRSAQAPDVSETMIGAQVDACHDTVVNAVSGWLLPCICGTDCIWRGGCIVGEFSGLLLLLSRRICFSPVMIPTYFHALTSTISQGSFLRGTKAAIVVQSRDQKAILVRRQQNVVYLL